MRRLRRADVFRIALGALFSIAALARPSPPEDAAALVVRAQALLAAGNPAKASPLFERAVAAEPKRAEYHYWLAKSYSAEAAQSANVLRLAILGWSIGDELQAAVDLDGEL